MCCEITVLSFIWQFQNLAKELQNEFKGVREWGLDDRVAIVDDSDVGIKQFDSFGKDIFLNIQKLLVTYAQRSGAKYTHII